VSEVGVVGLPDEKWGQVVAAFVVPERAEVTKEEIDAYLRENTNLANFKRPKKVVFVKQLPKSPVGKLLRRLLVEGEYEEIEASAENTEVKA
jgi:2-furoate---CoA ligase